ncbi:hypothetical protein BX666DRAFT_2030925 [Dichotomocladium elegans]|nr:hypothetical protein BX666DRAFT_2030925 [Dichotomocladium elegans]
MIPCRSFLAVLLLFIISTTIAATSVDHALLFERAEPGEVDSATTTTSRKSSPSVEPHATTSTKQAPTAARSASSGSKAALSTNRASSAGASRSAGNDYSQRRISTLSASAVRSTSAVSSTPTASSQLTGNSASPLSVGAIVGIAVGGVVLLGMIAALLATRRRKRREQLYKTRMMKPDPFTMGFGSHDPPPPPLKVSSPHVAFNMAPPTPMVQMASPIASPSPSLPPTSPPSTSATTTTTTTLAPSPGTNRSIGIFTVVSTYTPTLSDELDIQAGDKVEIFIEYDDGWCQGVNLSRGAVKGVFPKHCVDYYQKQHLPDSTKRVSSMYMSQTSYYM